MDQPDGELVAGYLTGNDLCFAELVRRHQGALYWLLTEVTNDAMLAEDAAQETLMVAAGSLRSLKQPGGFRNWLLGIGHHKGCDQVRQALRGPTTVPLSEDADLAPATNTGPSLRHEHPMRERLDRLLATMDAEDRSLLHLCHGEEYTYGDIAEILGDSPDALRQRASRIRRDLACRLAKPEEKTA